MNYNVFNKYCNDMKIQDIQRKLNISYPEAKKFKEHAELLNLFSVIKCNCPKESIDIYDEFGNLLGWACLECGIVKQ